MTGHLCPDCQRCPACGRSAWCESDRILRVPCEHHGYCGECNLTECAACRIAEGLEHAIQTFGGDPFARPGDTTDPLPELAAESRAVTDRFWATAGERPRLHPNRELP